MVPKNVDLTKILTAKIFDPPKSVAPLIYFDTNNILTSSILGIKLGVKKKQSKTKNNCHPTGCFFAATVGPSGLAKHKL